MLKRFLTTAISMMLLSVLLGAQEPDKPRQDVKQPTSIYDFKMDSIDGREVDFKKYRGKVVLMVNVASECGLTDQYDGLEVLQSILKKRGFTVAGFPCNQFGGQEPESNQKIAQFCKKKYGVTFDMFAKVEVNGDNACELYRYLASVDVKPAGAGKIGWNFEKFLIGRDGKVVARFDSAAEPDDEKLLDAIKAAVEVKE